MNLFESGSDDKGIIQIIVFLYSLSLQVEKNLGRESNRPNTMVSYSGLTSSQYKMNKVKE
jgi:hypothetical protein